MCVYMDVCVYVCVGMYVMYVCLFVCLYVCLLKCLNFYIYECHQQRKVTPACRVWPTTSRMERGTSDDTAASDEEVDEDDKVDKDNKPLSCGPNTDCSF